MHQWFTLMVVIRKRHVAGPSLTTNYKYAQQVKFATLNYLLSHFRAVQCSKLFSGHRKIVPIWTFNICCNNYKPFFSNDLRIFLVIYESILDWGRSSWVCIDSHIQQPTCRYPGWMHSPGADPCGCTETQCPPACAPLPRVSATLPSSAIRLLHLGVQRPHHSPSHMPVDIQCECIPLGPLHVGVQRPPHPPACAPVPRMSAVLWDHSIWACRDPGVRHPTCRYSGWVHSPGAAPHGSQRTSCPPPHSLVPKDHPTRLKLRQESAVPWHIITLRCLGQTHSVPLWHSGTNRLGELGSATRTFG